ncbi:zinc finger domain-containing protein [Halobacteriovorax sp. GB3]
MTNLVVFYQKTCGLCHKSEVKKITLAGRGTYYCPSCQR